MTVPVASSAAPPAQGLTAAEPPGLGTRDTAVDMGKSIGVGAAKSLIEFAGLPDDITELGARGINAAAQYVGGKLGVDMPARAPQQPRYGADAIKHAVEAVTGKFYEPRSTLGKYAQTEGEFLLALAGGPEALAAIRN